MLGSEYFVSPAVQELPVKFGGIEQKKFFCKVPAYDWNRFLQLLRSKDADERALAPFVLVAASLCDADGKPLVNVETAKTMGKVAHEALFVQALAANKEDDPEGNG